MWLEFVAVSVSKEMVWLLQECTTCVSFLLGSSLPSVKVLYEGTGQSDQGTPLGGLCAWGGRMLVAVREAI